MSFELGLLFLKAGGGDQVRYADFGLFAGEELPIPTTCPAIGSWATCGGACRGCSSADDVCTGRSRLHPNGICVPKSSEHCYPPGLYCPADQGCFIYTVEPAAQAVADWYGICLELAHCQALASELPGGGKCVTL